MSAEDNTGKFHKFVTCLFPEDMTLIEQLQLENDMQYLIANAIEEKYPELRFIVVDECGINICHIEHVKSGVLYDVWRYTCCGYEHAESRTDAGASEIPTNFCPKCGARVVGMKRG